MFQQLSPTQLANTIPRPLSARKNAHQIGADDRRHSASRAAERFLHRRRLYQIGRNLAEEQHKSQKTKLIQKVYRQKPPKKSEQHYERRMNECNIFPDRPMMSVTTCNFRRSSHSAFERTNASRRRQGRDDYVHSSISRDSPSPRGRVSREDRILRSCVVGTLKISRQIARCIQETDQFLGEQCYVSNESLDNNNCTEEDKKGRKNVTEFFSAVNEEAVSLAKLCTTEPTVELSQDAVLSDASLCESSRDVLSEEASNCSTQNQSESSSRTSDEAPSDEVRHEKEVELQSFLKELLKGQRERKTLRGLRHHTLDQAQKLNEVAPGVESYFNSWKNQQTHSEVMQNSRKKLERTHKLLGKSTHVVNEARDPYLQSSRKEEKPNENLSREEHRGVQRKLLRQQKENETLGDRVIQLKLENRKLKESLINERFRTTLQRQKFTTIDDRRVMTKNSLASNAKSGQDFCFEKNEWGEKGKEGPTIQLSTAATTANPEALFLRYKRNETKNNINSKFVEEHKGEELEGEQRPEEKLAIRQNETRDFSARIQKLQEKFKAIKVKVDNTTLGTDSDKWSLRAEVARVKEDLPNQLSQSNSTVPNTLTAVAPRKVEVEETENADIDSNDDSLNSKTEGENADKLPIASESLENDKTDEEKGDKPPQKTRMSPLCLNLTSIPEVNEDSLSG